MRNRVKIKIISIAVVIISAILLMLICAPAFATTVLEIHADTTNGSTTFTT